MSAESSEGAGSLALVKQKRSNVSLRQSMSPSIHPKAVTRLQVEGWGGDLAGAVGAPRDSHGARPVHLIITVIKWMRIRKLSIPCRSRRSSPRRACSRRARRTPRARATRGPGEEKSLCKIKKKKKKKSLYKIWAAARTCDACPPWFSV